MWKRAVVMLMVCAMVAEAKDPPDVAAINKLVAAEAKPVTDPGNPDTIAAAFTADALVASPSFVPAKASDGIAMAVLDAPYITVFTPGGIRVGLARDGQSAWVTYSATTQTACDSCMSMDGPTVRASQLVVKVKGSWHVQAALFSQGVADAKVNKAGKAGKLDALEKVADADQGDAAVRDAFKALVTKGFDPALATNKDLIGIGSAPKEMTVGGKGLVPFFNKSWVGNMAIKGPVVAVMAPSGTTAAVLANVDLTKTDGKAKYAVPFRWFVVFDKDAAGAWTPIHVHFAVAAQ